MIKYCGRYLPIWQYMKAKPCWYGVKIWCLVNAKLKYVQRMEMYYGACGEDVEHAIWYKIIIGLTKGYKNKNHIVSCDNFFSSIGLFWVLLHVGMQYAIETCRIDCNL
jgi:hypothetical protein